MCGACAASALWIIRVVSGGNRISEKAGCRCTESGTTARTSICDARRARQSSASHGSASVRGCASDTTSTSGAPVVARNCSRARCTCCRVSSCDTFGQSSTRITRRGGGASPAWPRGTRAKRAKRADAWRNAAKRSTDDCRTPVSRSASQFSHSTTSKCSCVARASACSVALLPAPLGPVKARMRWVSRAHVRGTCAEMEHHPEPL